MQPEPASVERRGRASIENIADNRKPGAREMHANLMPHSGRRKHRKQTHIVDPPHGLDPRERGPGSELDPLGLVFDENHFARIFRMMRDWVVEVERGPEVIRHYREVFALDGA